MKTLKEQIESVENIIVTYDNVRFFEWTVFGIVSDVKRRALQNYKVNAADTKYALKVLKSIFTKYEELSDYYAVELSELYPNAGF